MNREYAAIVALVGVYELGRNWVIFGGPGREFESHESFWLLKVGITYEIKIPNNWAISPSIVYDYKDVYDSWSVGVSFGKRL